MLARPGGRRCCHVACSEDRRPTALHVSPRCRCVFARLNCHVAHGSFEHALIPHMRDMSRVYLISCTVTPFRSTFPFGGRLRDVIDRLLPLTAFKYFKLHIYGNSNTACDPTRARPAPIMLS